MADSKNRPPASDNRHRRPEDPGESQGPEELSPAEVARLTRELKRLEEEARLHKEELERLAQANRQLREENESLQALFQAAPLAMGVFDAEGRLLKVNPASERIFGWTQAEVEGRLPLSIPPENPQESLEILRRVLQGESFVGTEIRQRRKDGSLIDLSFSAAPLYDAQGRPRGFVGLAEDITERKKAQAKLLQVTEEWERTFDAVPDCIAILDQEHRIIRLNRAMAALLGRAPEEILGQPCYKVIHNLAEPPDFCPHARLLATGQEQFAEVQELGRIFEVSVSPLLGPDGQVRGSVHVARDISGHKQIEEALRWSNQRLDLLAETASRLLATDSPQKVVDFLCQKVMAFLDCDVFFNYLRDEGEERLHLNAYAGIPDEEARKIEWLDFGVAVCGSAARDKCRIVVEDVQAAQDPRTELIKSYGIQAYACHPLLVQDQVLGTISFGTRKRSRFTPDELSLMKAVADHVAIAISRMQAEEALRRAKEELELRVQERTAELRLSNESLLREIEERQQAEEALAVERQRLMAVLDRIPAYVALLAPDCTLSVVNREFKERFGEPGNRHCYEFLFDRKEPCPECKALKVFQTKTPEIWEWSGPDGRIYQIYDYPFTDVDGSPLVLELGVDITDRKQTEEALRKSEENLHLLAARLLEVQESERSRFSRELHDELGQTLLLLKFKLSAVQAGLDDAADELRQECREAQQFLDELVDKVRRLSRDLSPSPLEELGLTSALKYVFHECCKHYKFSGYSVKIEDIDGCFGATRQVNIYRIFQEALTNIGKHAEADKISVTVKRQSRRATFTITDNGKGFQVSEALSRPAEKRGLGLAAIQERLRMMGGDLKIISRKGAGTKLVFTVPFGQE